MACKVTRRRVTVYIMKYMTLRTLKRNVRTTIVVLGIVFVVPALYLHASGKTFIVSPSAIDLEVYVGEGATSESITITPGTGDFEDYQVEYQFFPEGSYGEEHCLEWSGTPYGSLCDEYDFESWADDGLLCNFLEFGEPDDGTQSLSLPNDSEDTVPISLTVPCHSGECGIRDSQDRLVFPEELLDVPLTCEVKVAGAPQVSMGPIRAYAQEATDTDTVRVSATVTHQPVGEPILTLPTEGRYNGERGVDSGGPNPERGYPDDEVFTFKVVYTHPKDIAPDNVEVHLSEEPFTPLLSIDQEAEDPVLRDGDYTNGEQYVATTTLSKGKQEYAFWATNGGNTFILGTNPSGEILTCGTGYSSIAFVPGFQASRLARPINTQSIQRLWEPVLGGNELELVMNKDGEPEYSGIFTTGIIDEGLTWGIAPNIYKSFISFMNGLVENKTINNWSALPYDWRYDIGDVIDNPIMTQTGSYSILNEVERLASTSDSGRVMVIGHSNGGLIGKMILSKLAETNKRNIVDQFIMAGTPQFGTPKAVASLLHGTQQSVPQSLGVLLSKESARTIARNLPGAYNLLPSAEYFVTVESPVTMFQEYNSQYSKTALYTDAYGVEIDTIEELQDFLAGDEGREEPLPHETKLPIILNKNMLAQAQENHEQLDVWTAPEGVDVIQIAGWGLDTILTLKYRNKPCLFPEPGCELDYYLDKDSYTAEGDETVVYPSAVGMDGVDTYFLNLYNYNDDHIDRKHASILEVESVLELIENKLTYNEALPEYITQDKPDVGVLGKRIRLRGLSPITLKVEDSAGNYTGLCESVNLNSTLNCVQEDISNSYYFELGEGKYIGLGGDGVYTVEVEGTDTGTFTIEIDEVENDTVVRTLVFKDIPVTNELTGIMTLNASQNEFNPILELDNDNDGVVDEVLQPEAQDKEQDPLVIVTELKTYISSIDVYRFVKRHLLFKVRILKWYIEKEKEKRTLYTIRKMKHVTKWYAKWNLISKEEKKTIDTYLTDFKQALENK